MSTELTRHQFNVDEYHRMGQAGILSETDRVELIEGEIIEMTPIGSRHAACVNRLTHLFSQNQENFVVHVQNPIRIGEHSEPQPDLALLKPRSDFYAESHPRPEDVLLIVEVADTSLEYDQQIKIPLYARSGISETWLIDLSDQCIDVYRKPSATGYENVHRIDQRTTFSAEAFPQLTFNLKDFLG